MTSLWIYVSALLVISDGAIKKIDCGQSLTGITMAGETISFQITNDQKQDIYLSDSNSTFIPVLTVRDSNGQYLQSAFAIDCDGRHNVADSFYCDGGYGTVFPLTFSSGQFIVEMIPNGNGGAFKLDVVCSVDDSHGDFRYFTD